MIFDNIIRNLYSVDHPNHTMHQYPDSMIDSDYSSSISVGGGGSSSSSSSSSRYGKQDVVKHCFAAPVCSFTSLGL